MIIASGVIQFSKQKQDELKINELNKQINSKVPKKMYQRNIIGAGWYRFAKLTGYEDKLSTVTGGYGNSVLIAVKTAYSTNGNVSDFILLNNSYCRSNFTVLGSSHYEDNISKIRHVIDTTNKIAYLEFYYNNFGTVYSNPVQIELYSAQSCRNTWELMTMN